MAIKSTNPNPGQASPWQPLFYAVPEVARRLGIGQTSTWALIRDKKLSVVKIGRRTLVPVQALTDFAAALSSSKR